MGSANVRVIRFAFALGVVFGLAACNEGDPLTGPGFTCDVTNPVGDVIINPTAAVVLVHSPARDTDLGKITATATNRFGDIRTDVPIKFTSSDTTIATVDSTGTIHPRTPGVVRVTASTCDVKAVATITIELAAVRVKVTADTSAVVAGDSVLVRAQAFTQDSVLIPGAKFTFTASPATGITISQKSDATAMIKTQNPGTFTITATGEGSSASTQLLVAPRLFVNSALVAGNGLDVGKDFGCGLISLGRLHCWGSNGSGRLGASADSTCFGELNMDPPGTTACSLNPIRTGPNRTFAAVSAGDAFACGIVASGSAYCWGNGVFGKLGNGQAAGSPIPTLVTSGLSFTSISAGGDHACAIATTGGAFCWGLDSVGQLGDARLVHSTTPIPVFGGGGLVSISAGLQHTCALDGAGNAACWGQNESGQLGLGFAGGYVDALAGIAGGLHFTAISAGGDTVKRTPGSVVPIIYESHTCAIATGGAAYCWGSNVSGQLGIGSVGGSSSVPVPVAGGISFTKISAGGRHTCGLATNGAVYCWGRGLDLQLGRGDPTGTGADSGTPQAVSGGELPAAVTFTAVSAGTRHSCALGSDGNVYCWGSNVFGALGNTLQAAFRGLPQRVAIPK